MCTWRLEIRILLTAFESTENFFGSMRKLYHFKYDRESKMCGVAGFVDLNKPSSNQSKEYLLNMLNTIKHREPMVKEFAFLSQMV